MAEAAYRLAREKLMRIMGLSFSALLLLGVIGIPAAVAQGVIPILYNSVAELKGGWLGGSMDGEYIHLRINEKGVGTLSIQWLPGEDAAIYEINGTSLAGKVVTFKIAEKENQFKILLYGNAIKGKLDLTIESTNRNWRIEHTLWRESMVLSRIRAVTIN